MNPGITEPDLKTAGAPAPARTKISLWVNAVALLGSVLLAAGAAIAYFKPGMLLSPQDQVSEGVRIYAGYLISRNAALALALLAALCFRMRALMGTMLLLVGGIQILDAFIDAAEGRWALVPGVAILGLVFLLGAVTRRPFRQAAA